MASTASSRIGVARGLRALFACYLSGWRVWRPLKRRAGLVGGLNARRRCSVRLGVVLMRSRAFVASVCRDWDR